MEITYETGLPETKRAFLIRSKPIHNLLAFLCALALTGGFVWFMGFKVGVMPGWQMLLMSPIVVFGGLVLLLIDCVAWGAFRSSLRPTNWSWIIRETEVLIHLRDYRNAQPGQPTPVLRLRVEELVGAVVVKESYKTKSQKGTTYHASQYIDLQVDGLEVEPLRAVLAETAKHPGLVNKKGTSSTKFQTNPVQLIGEDVLRVAHSKRLQFGLEHVVTFGEPRTLDLNEAWDDLKPLQRALEWQKRGHSFRAEQFLAKEEAMSIKEARALLQKYSADQQEAA